MKFSLLTYNTLFNNALISIEEVISDIKPDILCFQEINTLPSNLIKIEKYGYKLADYGSSFIKFGQPFGVATYYNPKKIRHIKTSHLNLGYRPIEVLFTLFQLILGYKKAKTMLKTEFLLGKTLKLSVCNTHLYVIGSNALRIKHLINALKEIEIKKDRNLIVTGDFNYLPYQRKKLEEVMKSYRMKEATHNISQTIKFSHDGQFEKFNIFQKIGLTIFSRLLKNLKIDYIFYRGVRLNQTQRAEVRYSDHYPIISYFTI